MLDVGPHDEEKDQDNRLLGLGFHVLFEPVGDSGVGAIFHHR